jgi:hypothetical protein
MSARRTASNDAPGPADVVQWRRDRLAAAGFADELAADLARSRHIDLHAVLDLIDHGCPPALAARILAPLDQPTQLEHP